MHYENYESITFARAEGILTVTLNRPDARNALTFTMYEEIARIVTAVQNASAEDGITWVQSLCDRLEVTPLRHS